MSDPKGSVATGGEHVAMNNRSLGASLGLGLDIFILQTIFHLRSDQIIPPARV